MLNVWGKGFVLLNKDKWMYVLMDSLGEMRDFNGIQ